MARPDFSSLNADNIVAFIVDIFARRGPVRSLGEEVTMSQHQLQRDFLAEQVEAGPPGAMAGGADGGAGCRESAGYGKATAQRDRRRCRADKYV